MGQGWVGDYFSGGEPVILQPKTLVCVRVWISAGLPFIRTGNRYKTHFRIAQNWNGTGPFEM